jgi:hypothetical protein
MKDTYEITTKNPLWAKFFHQKIANFYLHLYYFSTTLSNNAFLFNLLPLLI